MDDQQDQRIMKTLMTVWDYCMAYHQAIGKTYQEAHDATVVDMDLFVKEAIMSHREDQKSS
jgi:hypothetical protein